ncbi:MAG: hypothetical protein ACI4XN_12470 [Candidatus Kurthia intestinigallinarum]
MATPYEKVYGRFLQKITDFNLAEVDDYSFDEMMNGWLNSAVIRVRKCQHDLSKRDDELQEFEEDLSDLEVELLALGMVDAWVTPMLNSTELTLQFIGGKEEKVYAQSSHIKELRSLKESNLLEMNRLHNYNTYLNNSYFDD